MLPVDRPEVTVPVSVTTRVAPTVVEVKSEEVVELWPVFQGCPATRMARTASWN
ncbi:hypothetical protein [Saccharothrix luteola]|uniref:hypothetical protein n=1 Tax=Saccharothrix luteola TaxID=2893018 RepID=UPI001E53F93B|nr:hypothetical protein [Saccharothrix luteola]MCC8242733.1 hypothetical protein [Saccharothrix luteola]